MAATDRRIHWICFATLLSGYLLLFTTSYERETDTTVTFNYGYLVLGVWMVVCFIATVIYGVYCTIRKRKTNIWLFLLLLPAPLVGMISLVNLASSLHVQTTVRDTDGQTYALLARHFLQGSELMIARSKSSSLLQDQYEILARSPWEETSGYLKLVHPPKSTPGMHLVLTSDHLLVGIPHGSDAYLAYDLRSKLAYGDDTCEEDEVRLCKPISELPPTILASP